MKKIRKYTIYATQKWYTLVHRYTLQSTDYTHIKRIVTMMSYATVIKTKKKLSKKQINLKLKIYLCVKKFWNVIPRRY